MKHINNIHLNLIIIQKDVNTITHGPLRMERSHSQNATLPTKCVGTLAHSREIVPILRKPRGRQRT